MSYWWRYEEIEWIDFTKLVNDSEKQKKRWNIICLPASFEDTKNEIKTEIWSVLTDEDLKKIIIDEARCFFRNFSVDGRTTDEASLYNMEKCITNNLDVNSLSFWRNLPILQIPIFADNWLRLFQLLLQHPQIDVNKSLNKSKERIIHQLWRNGKIYPLYLLLQHPKIEINTQDKYWITALHEAAFWCFPDIVELLVNKWININIKNNKWKTALQNALALINDANRTWKIKKVISILLKSWIITDNLLEKEIKQIISLWFTI